MIFKDVSHWQIQYIIFCSTFIVIVPTYIYMVHITYALIVIKTSKTSVILLEVFWEVLLARVSCVSCDMRHSPLVLLNNISLFVGKWPRAERCIGMSPCTSRSSYVNGNWNYRHLLIGKYNTLIFEITLLP